MARGSIRKKGNAYEVRVCVGKTADGKYKYISKSARTKRDAEEELNKLLASLRDGTFVEPSKLTVAEYLDKWLEMVRPALKPRTWEGYARDVERHLKPALGGYRLQELRPLHVQEMIQKKLGELDPKTIRNILGTLSTALNRAVKLGVLARNVAAAVEAPRVPRREMQILTEEEMRRLREAARGDRLEALWVLALATGMREGELLGLRWQDVDLKAGTVRVAQSVSWTKNGPVFVEPKTAGSRRTIPVGSAVVEALKAHRKRQMEERLKAGETWQETGLVFTNETGGVLHKNAVSYRPFLKLLERAGVKKVRFHDIRHSVISLMLSKGHPIKTVQAISGHSTTAMLLDRYGHAIPGTERAAANTMDAILGN